MRVYHLQKNFRKSDRYLKSAHFKRDVTSRDHGELEDNQIQTNLLIPSRVTIEKSNKAKYFEVLAPWLTFVPFMGAQIVLIEKRIEVIFDCQR